MSNQTDPLISYLQNRVHSLEQSENELRRLLSTMTTAFEQVQSQFTELLAYQVRSSQRTLSSPDQTSFQKDTVAVFWDYENTRVPAQGINLPLAEALMTYSESLGHPRIKRVYSNWQKENVVSVQALYSLGFEPIHVSMGKPNSVDLKLTVDCLSTAYNYPELHQFIIVTADKDFIPLVNALKAIQKWVIIIGQADVVSEHLMLSAHEFVSLETLPQYANSSDKTIDEEPSKTISYEDAIKCLLAAIDEARDQGKSTRLSLVNNLMMSSRQFPNYLGVASIRGRNGTTFSKFDLFIASASADRKIKVQTVGGFKELFLVEDDPQSESEFVSQKSEKIDANQWLTIINQVEKAFQDGVPSEYWYGKYGHLHKYIRSAKKNGNLLISNKTLQAVINQLAEVGVLILQNDSRYCLVANLEEMKSEFIKKLVRR